MATKNWEEDALETLFEHNHDYIQKALLHYCNLLLIEQKERIEKMEGELDGTMWNHSKWNG